MLAWWTHGDRSASSAPQLPHRVFVQFWIAPQTGSSGLVYKGICPISSDWWSAPSVAAPEQSPQIEKVTICTGGSSALFGTGCWIGAKSPCRQVLHARRYPEQTNKSYFAVMQHPQTQRKGNASHSYVMNTPWLEPRLTECLSNWMLCIALLQANMVTKQREGKEPLLTTDGSFLSSYFP